MKLEILVNEIYHKRFETTSHQFTYRAFSFRFDVSKYQALKNAIFQIGRFGLLSLHSEDYLWSEKNKDFKKVFEDFIDKNNIQLKTYDKVVLQTFPRFLGYGFNPVNFWMTYKDSFLQEVLVEVNNTFGEKHCYFLSDPLNKNNRISKCFHVSPFFDTSGEYQFVFKENYVGINLFKNKALAIATSISSKPIEYNMKNLVKLLFRFPLQSFVVVFRIHWHALILWIKKVPFYTKPNPPMKEFTK